VPDEVINGYLMHYETYGQGPTLVMIHGGLGGGQGAAAMVEHHASILARHFNVIFYDRRGAGKSETPAEGYSLEGYTEDLHSLLLQLNVDQAHILGTSAGGPIAMQFALDHPKMTETLILINTMSYCQESERTVRQQELEQILVCQASSGDVTAAANALEKGWPGLSRREPARLQALLESSQERMDAIAKTIPSYLDIGNSLESRLAELTMPTLIVHGDADSRIPLPCGRQLQNSISSSELYIIPGAEHGLLSNEPRAVRNLIFQFIERFAPVSSSASTIRS
jgi:3-oxoadipate enol-lactonase